MHDRLTKQQLAGIADMIHYVHDEENPSWSKEKTVQLLAGIHYDAMLKAVKVASKLTKSENSVATPLSALKTASDNYKASISENKVQEYIDFLVANAEVELLHKTLEPIAHSIPGGKLLVKGLDKLLALKKQN